MRLSKAQIFVISLLLTLVGILVYLNYNTPFQDKIEPSVRDTPAEIKEFDFNAYFASTKDSLPAELRNKIAHLEQVILNDSVNTLALLQLVSLYDSLGYKLLSANCLKLAAQKRNQEHLWFSTGLKYYDIASNHNDTGILIYSTNNAIEAFEAVTRLNENNLEAKNALALCYVQSGNNAMKGMQLLKDVLRRDSNNIEANYTSGMLSMRSGQYDKALLRFKKLVDLQPFNAEYFYYLGEVYAQLGKNSESIRAFETSKTLMPANETSKDIDIIINNLKNSK